MQKDFSNHSINDLTLLKRKENANDCNDEHLGRTQKEYRTIPRSQQVRQRKGQSFEGIDEEYDYAVAPKTGWMFHKGSRRRTCRQLCQGHGATCRQLRHRQQIGTEPIGRRTIGILSILQALTIGGEKPPANRRRCEQYPHKYSTNRVAQHDHISSREHAWLNSWKAQDRTSLCPKTIVIHVSCLIPCRN